MKAPNALAVAVIGTLTLYGCATQTPVPVTETPVEVVPEPVVEAPPRPFPAETLYALLVAEMAGSRERYDIALGNYIQQAHKTRDPGVTARATRIARFLGARQAALNTALLWVQLQPDNREARMIAATELAQAGRLLEAFEQSSQLLALGSTPIFQTIAARAVQVTDTQREQLLEQYQMLLLQHPQNMQLLVGRGLLLQQQTELEAALDSARQALAQDTTYIPAAILEAKLLHQLEMPEQALERLVQLLQQFPENKRLRLQYARLLANYDLEQAHRQFSLLVEQSPDDPELVFSLALVSNERGLKEEARRYFERLLTLGHRRSSAHFYLGRLEEESENYNQALQHYWQVEPGPDFLPAILQSTDILVRQNSLGEANERLDKLRQRFPDQAERFYLLESEVLGQHDYLDEAQSLLTGALQQNPTSAKLLYARAMINERRDLLDVMERDLRTILKYEPNNATALNALGYTLADRTTRYEEALELISQALDIRPDDPAIIDSMGWVHYRLGNFDEALLRLREAMKAYPDHEIAAHLGEVLWVLGREQEAREIWREGLRLNPNSEVIPATMQRLQKQVSEDSGK
ncbi:tetratricopeptide repeat protein [Exilibacterium tricleocarpae]|uniref:Tetratricopeptide repeat protein n=1 Tax=Exilibacterium tricleocarpae TaxID=2591008 RepID=A0A545U5P4_9GAMM|nr:tetratricopeptide repeat protein [Exilibacterium tricleocarpae]TQV84794.1 tetratricopeptide repeat protein [Exilibacterium tricleocarpae]